METMDEKIEHGEAVMWATTNGYAMGVAVGQADGRRRTWVRNERGVTVLMRTSHLRPIR